jgi:hypothetical protein
LRWVSRTPVDLYHYTPGIMFVTILTDRTVSVISYGDKNAGELDYGAGPTEVRR